MQVHAFEPPSATVMEPELSMAAEALSVKVHVGEVWIVSDEVKLRVMTSPSFALPAPAVAIETEDSVGWVLSMVTLVESVTAETAVPALPAESVKAIEKVIAPLESAL